VLVAETSAHALVRARLRGREVLIKAQKREARGDPSLEREAAALRALAGPGVVGLVAVERGSLVLEYVRGPTLAARIERAVLSARELDELAAALGATLDRIHRAGWVYADLKPENVILRRGRVADPVLVDFETAVRVGEPYAPRVTTAYAAPERLVGAATADARSDLFALGALLHAAAEGASPFAAPSRDASVLRVLALEPRRATTASPELADKIAALLEKEPARRPASFDALGAVPRAPSERFRLETHGDAAPAARPSGASPNLRIVGERAEDALLAFVVDAVARRELLLMFEPSTRAHGSLAASVLRLLGVADGASFRVVEAAARRALERDHGAAARDMAAILADVLAGEPDASERTVLDALRADPALLRARRQEAFVALLRTHANARDVVAAASAPDPESRAVLERMIAEGFRPRLVFVDGALDLPADVVVASAPVAPEAAPEPVARPLAVAAVWGEVFDARELAELAGDSHLVAWGAIAAGVGAGLLAADPFGRGFRFRTAALRDRVAAGLGPAERAAIAPALAWLVARRFARDDERVARAFAAAGEPLRAAYYAWRGAARALDVSDHAAAAPLVALGDEMLARVTGSVRSLLGAMLDLVRAGVERFRGDYRSASVAARRALAFLPAGSRAFCEALGERATAAGRIGDPVEVIAVATALRAEPSPDATFAWDRACSRTAVQLFYLGRLREARALVGLFRERTLDVRGRPDERRRARSPGCLVTAALYDDRLDEHIERLGAAIREFESIGDWRSACLYGSALGFAWGLVGEYARAEQILRETLAKSERTTAATALRGIALHNLGEVVAHRRGRLDEGIAIETDAIVILRAQGDNRLLSGSLAYRARMWVEKGDLDAAERDAREAIVHATAFPSIAPWLFATLALVMLERGRKDEALELAARAAAGAPETREVSAATVALAHARALSVTGRVREAATVLRSASRDLEHRARRIADPRLRAGYLGRVPDHAALLIAARTAPRAKGRLPW
jgi:tetratricopeptide (TPR) repeat protein